MSIMNGRNFARQARDYLIEEQKRVDEARRSAEPAPPFADRSVREYLRRTSVAYSHLHSWDEDPKPPRRSDEAAQNQVEGRK